MKKAILIGIVALFALAVFSCDAFNIPNGGPVGQEPVGIEAWNIQDEPPLQPGEFFVGYSGISGNRALTSALARAGSDYFEAVLTDGTLVHRAVFREGRTGRMTAPSLGNYNNTTGTLKAYLFAGRYSDKTLLGIGVITNIDNGSGFVGGTNIGAATRGVAFTIEPLTTDVNTKGDNSSTFKPWIGAGAGAEADISARIMIDNLPASIFLLPAHTTMTGVTYTIISTRGPAIVALPTTTYTTPIPEVISNGFIWDDGDYAPITVPTTITAVANAAAITITMTIDTNDSTLTAITSGLGRLSIDVPVVNLSDEDADNQQIPDLKAPVIWHIKGGMNNFIIDQGPDFNEARGSMGGAILIGVGNVLSGAGGFIVKAGYAPWTP